MTIKKINCVNKFEFSQGNNPETHNSLQKGLNRDKESIVKNICGSIDMKTL